MFWVLFALFGGLLGNGSFPMGLAQLYPPFAAMLARKAYKDNPDLIPTVSDLIQQRYRKLIGVAEYQALMAEAGYDRETAENMFMAGESMLTGYDYVALWRRELMTESDLDIQLEKLGYTDLQKQNLKDATLYYPQPSDIVQFAVREVYKPDIVTKYGQDLELDPLYIKQAKQAGLSEDFATKYWQSHWQLPSAQMGYDMYQREIIGQDDLSKLLATLDYMPYWRDKLLKLQYNVVTRVDVRRMYQGGVYDENKVYQTYLHQGYSPEDARDLTNWTVKAYPRKPSVAIAGTGLVVADDGLIHPSESLIIDSYKRGLITKGTADFELRKLLYANDTIELLLNRVDDQTKQDNIDLQANGITDQYRAGAIDLAEYKVQLTSLGVQSQYMENVIARELAQAKQRIKMPTKADLDKWLKIGLIDSDYYVNSMLVMGYRASDIELYMQEIAYDMLTPAEKTQLAGGNSNGQ